MQATVQNGQQAPQNVQRQSQPQQQQQQQQQFPPQNPQQKAQLHQQLQQQQQVLQQMQAYQEQRLRFLQTQRGQAQQQGQALQQGQQAQQQGQIMQQNAQHQGQIMQNSQQLSKQQQQQLSVQLPGSRRTSFRDGGGMGTPKSSANRPPSAQPRPPSVMRQSASPMRPPSAQPASRQSFNMSAAGGGPQLQVLPQALSPNSPTFKFYNPLKSSKRGSRDSSSSNSLTVQGVAHASSSNSIMQLSHPQMSATMNNANNEVFATSAPQQIPTINPAILNQYLPMATPNNVTTTPSDVERRPSQIQKSSSTSTPTSSSGKTSMPRQQPHESTLSYDEVRKLANQLSCEEKIVWVSKQVLGTLRHLPPNKFRLSIQPFSTNIYQWRRLIM